jgi:hypothetical protein
MSDSLRPCPFCGSEARLFRIAERDAHWVACTSEVCGIMTPLRYAKHEGHSVTVGMWNRRSAEYPVENAGANMHSSGSLFQPR